MKNLIVALAVVVSVFAVKAYAATTMVCQTHSGQQFVWVGNMCPAGSFFVSY